MPEDDKYDALEKIGMLSSRLVSPAVGITESGD